MATQGTWKDGGSGKGSGHGRINKDKFDDGWDRIWGKNKKTTKDSGCGDDDASESSKSDDRG